MRCQPKHRLAMFSRHNFLHDWLDIHTNVTWPWGFLDFLCVYCHAASNKSVSATFAERLVAFFLFCRYVPTELMQTILQVSLWTLRNELRWLGYWEVCAYTVQVWYCFSLLVWRSNFPVYVHEQQASTLLMYSTTSTSYSTFIQMSEIIQLLNNHYFSVHLFYS